MKTSRPFATISYNTSNFLQSKLQYLIVHRVISFFAFVTHFKEDDEKKDHIHLIIFPNGQYQTDSLYDYLSELDSSDPTNKPLGIMPCLNSKWADWFLYSSHDSAYLASKGLIKKYHYFESDFISSDSNFLHELIHTIDRTKYAKTQEFVDRVKNGTSFLEMVSNGQIPAPQFIQWRAIYDYLKSCDTYQNVIDSHTPLVDVETGELIHDELVIPNIK